VNFQVLREPAKVLLVKSLRTLAKQEPTKADVQVLENHRLENLGQQIAQVVATKILHRSRALPIQRFQLKRHRQKIAHRGNVTELAALKKTLN
jgi:dsRNA-specific ribonuclease